jgi:hypothetical protein
VQRPATFSATFVATPGVDGLRSFRALLKVALRRFGLRAIDVRELSARNEDEHTRSSSLSTHSAQTREVKMSEFSKRIREQRKGFFKVADLEGGKELTLTISHLDEEMEIFNEKKDLLNFVETGQQLQLNQTVAEWLIDNLGDDPEKWPGKRVTLYLAEYEYNKEKKLGIRLKLPPPGTGDGPVPVRPRKDAEVPF